MPRKQSGSRYMEVTDRILEALQKGVVPWERPWICGQPRNAETGRRYRGVNRLLLDFTALERGFSSPPASARKRPTPAAVSSPSGPSS